MHQVLARKWRPKTFSEVIGQQHITCALENTVKNNLPGHAYLFSGTRGVGKTSVARIFAKALRCENPNNSPCGKCSSCIDSNSSMNILEIDGASYNSVDNIRELTGNVQYLPTCGKYKIYIIDEVHMLSASAFNALLKTLEEPPSHIVFILATTHPEKLLDTVISRCQRFDFRRVSFNELNSFLKNISREENIVFESEKVMETIARQGNGSVRDTLSLLQQVLLHATDGKIDENILSFALGTADFQSIDSLMNSLLSGDTQKVMDVYESLIDKHVRVKNILLSLLENLFDLIKTKGKTETVSSSELLWIFETLAKDAQWAVESIHPEMITEIILQKISMRRSFFLTEKTQSSQSLSPPPASPVSSHNWEEMLCWLRSQGCVSASYLEHGNILRPIEKANGRVSLSIGFPQKGLFFYEQLQKETTRNNLLSHLSVFFKCPQNHVDLVLTLLNEREQKNFITQHEMEKHKERRVHMKEKEEFLQNPLLKQAQELFNSRIDKITMEDGSQTEQINR